MPLICSLSGTTCTRINASCLHNMYVDSVTDSRATLQRLSGQSTWPLNKVSNEGRLSAAFLLSYSLGMPWISSSLESAATANPFSQGVTPTLDGPVGQWSFQKGAFGMNLKWTFAAGLAIVPAGLGNMLVQGWPRGRCHFRKQNHAKRGDIASTCPRRSVAR